MGVKPNVPVQGEAQSPRPFSCLPPQLSFGIMAEALNGFETSSESAVHGGEDNNASWEQYLERRTLLLQFLRSDLSLHNLQHHWNNVELLKKCYFYLEVEPKHVNVRDQNDVLHCIDILQVIDPIRLERVKKVGKKQTEIQLFLLTELLEQLKRGWEELSCYVETWDMITFLSRWDLIVQRVSQLSMSMKNLRSLQEPGKLYIKHRLVSHAGLRGTRLSNIRLSLYTKRPLIFDRKESVAHKDWAELKWFTENQESHVEECELHVKLLTNGSQTEVGYGRLQQVTSNTCIVQNLQPGSSYEFTIRRLHTLTLVFVRWHDSITLKTQE
ncbi:fibronectin type III domain-containing protein 11 [Rissa tridactyla]|uniref:fibronectin type III domain-containing protein 11 n=1 Tax=Rissa tridactyla TaxID=75485 RepID=UPI0023BAEABE|nr:fibronectin type III domain-containing protein 11 [Rissa tridactyla]